MQPADTLSRADRVPVIDGITAARFHADIVPAYRPVVLRGLVADWPAVAAGRQSPQVMANYILGFDQGRPAKVMVGAPAIDGRFFYNDDLSGFNFKSAQVALPVFIDQLLRQVDQPDTPALYAGAAPAAENFSGWTDANPLPLAPPGAVPRIWIGNDSRVSTHYDVSANIAAVVAGRRRFTLFPPEQGRNLYVGPLDFTIAGQPVSMVDVEAPDLARYPRFAEALDCMQVADLEPGDAIFVPSMWWHDVRASGPLNVLVNYWREDAPASPFPALIHALLAVRDLPTEERKAVRAWFDQYVFGDDARSAADHLPPAALGVLGPPSPARAEAIRNYLVRAMGRI